MMGSLRKTWVTAAGLITAFLMTTFDASAQIPYQQPPELIRNVLSAPVLPSLSVNPSRDILILSEPEPYPPIAELAKPMLRLAGIRIDPTTNGRARPPRGTGRFTLIRDNGRIRSELNLGPGSWSRPHWSPHEPWFALTSSDGQSPITLTLVHSITGRVLRLADCALNATLADPIRWLPDSRSLILATVPKQRGDVPKPPATVIGPIVQETTGKAAPVRTYQDLLTNSYDEQLFEYYTQSQLMILTLTDMTTASASQSPWQLTAVGLPGIYTAFEPSPDGRYLLVSRIHRPFSYLHPCSAFPRTAEVWELPSGRRVHTVAESPLQDQVPIEGVPTGPRAIRWHPTDPATLYWVEALDGGDPKKSVPHRDELFRQAAPFSTPPESVYKIPHRFSDLRFFETAEALISDYDRERRWTTTVRLRLGDPNSTAIKLFDRSIQDRYNNPGSPVMKRLPNGHSVIRRVGTGMLLAGSGSSPQGDRPFLDHLDLVSGEKHRLFHCREGWYEAAVAILEGNGERLIIRRESPQTPPNYVLLDGQQERPLTDAPDPAPLLRSVQKQLLTTQRPDGVTISFTLYLPSEIKPGQKLPTVFWAYPQEFVSADTAGQISGSPNHFLLPTGASHLFFLTQGYAVMDEVSMPIIGPPETANDTFIQQLKMNAEAAIQRACDVAPIDRERIGIAGHSYGAFMAANLLAHTNLFRAGIARSGAYNRTLTPFGFQNERRTYWEAPKVYHEMSPFTAANRIREPLLLIHGAEDNNPGTFPMQSERMFQAIRGNGGIARLVILPHESHNYRARQSVEHTIAEMLAWFDRHVKQAPPR
jgi:dipeptidyl aminopeptidase/acylaminoacyl peptidase